MRHFAADVGGVGTGQYDELGELFGGEGRRVSACGASSRRLLRASRRAGAFSASASAAARMCPAPPASAGAIYGRFRDSSRMCGHGFITGIIGIASRMCARRARRCSQKGERLMLSNNACCNAVSGTVLQVLINQPPSGVG